MFELANGKVNPVSAVSGRHIDAVRRQLEKKRKQEEQRAENDRIAQQLNSRLKNERNSFEENCRLSTFPSIKSAVWVQAISHASTLRVTSPMVTVVVEVVRKLSNSSRPASVLSMILCIN